MPQLLATLWHAWDCWDCRRDKNPRRRAMAAVGLAWSLSWLVYMLTRKRHG